MPMIEFRYNPKKVSGMQAVELGATLEEALRNALREARPTRDDYGVFVEGDPFSICHNQPDLRIYVFYHQSWDFKEEELAALPKVMSRFLGPTLKTVGLAGVSGTIRFYIRSGHAGAHFGG